MATKGYVDRKHEWVEVTQDTTYYNLSCEYKVKRLHTDGKTYIMYIDQVTNEYIWYWTEVPYAQHYLEKNKMFHAGDVINTYMRCP